MNPKELFNRLSLLFLYFRPNSCLLCHKHDMAFSTGILFPNDGTRPAASLSSRSLSSGRRISATHLLEIHIVPCILFQEEVVDLEDLERIINICVSFLTIRDNCVYFMHQSAKEYLTMNASTLIIPAGHGQIHYDLFSCISSISGVISWRMPSPIYIIVLRARLDR